MTLIDNLRREMMSDTKKGKVATALAAVSTATTAYKMAEGWKKKFDERRTFIATIDSEAYVYQSMMMWLNRTVNPRRVRFDSTSRGIKRFYDGSAPTTVEVKGHVLTIEIEKPEKKGGLVDYDTYQSLMADTIVFTSHSRAGIDALHEWLDQLTEEENRANKSLYLFHTASFGWDAQVLSFRNLDSVFLPEGVKEALTDDVERFHAAEAYYARIGVPYHRGYLLYGEPGNGKSSVAAALAHKYRKNVYNLPLSTVKNDKELSSSIAKIGKNSILLLEDIDIFSETMAREQKSDKETPTLAGLLNALDGVSTPHGLMVFITTNKIESLDDALIRPGRVDFRMELKSPDLYQIESMFEYVYDEPLGVEPRAFKSMAQLSNIFQINPMDPESARLEIKA
jgi:hypothetical protein